MPRKPRYFLPGVPVHVVQRGNNREVVFFTDNDYLSYLRWMTEGAAKHGCQVHAYVLMTNHVHILVSPTTSSAIAEMMQYIGRRYVPYINHTYGRTGTLWEGRYKGSLIDDEQYLLTCMRYIELNPVRAGMVNTPSDYRWSSFMANAYGRENALVAPHERYLSLAFDEASRRRAYRGLFRYHIEDELLEDIRAACQTGTPLGNNRFKEQIESALGKKVGLPKRGRPTGNKKGTDPF